MASREDNNGLSFNFRYLLFIYFYLISFRHLVIGYHRLNLIENIHRLE